MNQRNQNIFDWVRIVAALMVFFSHFYAIWGREEAQLFGSTYGNLAVFIFFGLSGYLITMSIFKSGPNLTFVKKRILRIFPGLVVVALFMYLVLWWYAKQTNQHLGLGEIFKGIVYTVCMSDRPSYGIISKFKLPNDLNASLWTINRELLCYAILFLGMRFYFSKKTVVFLFAIFLLLNILNYHKVFQYQLYSFDLASVVEFSFAFFTGAVLACYQKVWFNYRMVIWIVGLIVLFSLRSFHLVELLKIVLIPLIVITLSTSFKDKIIGGKFDFSYGLYIYSFFIEQFVANIFEISFSMAISIALGISIILSMLSWYLVEKPFIDNTYIEKFSNMRNRFIKYIDKL